MSETGISVKDQIKVVNATWKKDAVMGPNLEKAASIGQELHAKYLEWLTEARIALQTAENELLRLRKVKVRYYNSELTKEELTKYGWLPYSKNRPLKSEMVELIECDDDIMVLRDGVEALKTLKTQLESILQAIKDRTFSIKDTIQMHKFNAGE